MGHIHVQAIIKTNDNEPSCEVRVLIGAIMTWPKRAAPSDLLRNYFADPRLKL